MTFSVSPTVTTPGKSDYDNCERAFCGAGTMAVTRDFETPDKPWARVIWRRCTDCGATTVQRVWAVAQ